MDQKKINSDGEPSSTPKPIRKDLVLKFLVIGDYGVGKTAIVKQYVEGKFTSNYKVTVGADFSTKLIQWDKATRINLQLWDIAGHERFGYMTRVYYKYAIGCLIVFDVSRYSTFLSCKKWLTELRDKVVCDNGRDIPVVLLANKWDIKETQISSEAINKFCKENKIEAWFETSAKENRNIQESIKYLVDEAVKITSNEERQGFSLLKGEEVKEPVQCCK